MKNFKSFLPKLVNGDSSYMYRGGSFEEKIKTFIEELMKDQTDQSEIFNQLRLNYPSAKVGLKKSGNPIQVDEISRKFKVNDTYSQRFENALFALLCIVLKDYDVNIVAMQTVQGDGGFDIAVLEQGTNNVCLLIDAKSGKNVQNNHVEWHSIQEDGDFWLMRVVKEGSDGLGLTFNIRGMKTHVLHTNLNQFIKNLIAMHLQDSAGINFIRKEEKLLADQLSCFSKNVLKKA